MQSSFDGFQSLITLGDEGTAFPHKKEDARSKDTDDAEFFNAMQKCKVG